MGCRARGGYSTNEGRLGAPRGESKGMWPLSPSDGRGHDGRGQATADARRGDARASMSPELAPVASKGVLPTMLSPPLINAQGNIRPLDTAAPSGMGFGFAGVGDSNVMAADANLG